MKKPKLNISIETVVDRLGEIKAKLAELQSEEKTLVEALKGVGPNIYKGASFEANVFSSSRASVDYKAIFEEAKVPLKTITKHTTSSEFLVCKVGAIQARSDEGKAAAISEALRAQL